MKRNLLRALSLLLVLVSLVSLIPPVRAEGLIPAQILVNYYGAQDRRAVMKNSEGTVYAPLSWLTFYCDLKMENDDGTWVYYSPEQAKERNFAKRLFIEPDRHEFAVGIYFTKKSLSLTERIYDNYYSLFEGNFSAWVEQDGPA